MGFELARAERHGPGERRSGARPGDRTRDYYERNAGEYAAATQAAAMDGFARSFAARLPEAALVLDAGCGGGRDLKRLSELGLAPVGLDYARGLAAIAHTYSGRPVVVGDVRAIPFASGALDGAWAVASLLHLARDELPVALAELRRVLKSRAPLFASVKHGRGESADKNGRRFTYYTPHEWARCLRTSGFEDVEVDVDTQVRGSAGGAEEVLWITSHCRAGRALDAAVEQAPAGGRSA